MLKKIRHLCIFLPKMSAYRRGLIKLFLSFLMKDEKLLEKYNEIWKKVSNIIKKEFDSKPIYNKKIYENYNKILQWKNQHQFSK